MGCTDDGHFRLGIKLRWCERNQAITVLQSTLKNWIGSTEFAHSKVASY